MEKGITVEKATKKDIAACVRLSLQGRRFHNALLPAYFKTDNISFEQNFLQKALINPKNDLFVARIDGEVRGMALVAYIRKEWLSESETAQIDNICVDENYRRQGIGKALLQTVYETAQTKGIQQMNLGVYCLNKNAIAFYQDFGFQPLSIKMHMKITSPE